MLEKYMLKLKEHMEKSIDALKKDYKSLRTGKVNTNILDGIKVDYYGTPTELSQVGSVFQLMLQLLQLILGKKSFGCN